MSPIKPSKTAAVLNGIITTVMIVWLLYIVLSALAYLTAIVDPVRGARWVQTNSLFRFTAPTPPAAAEVSSLSPRVHISLNAIMGYLKFTTADRWFLLGQGLLSLGRLLLFFFMLRSLQGFLESLQTGDPFNPQNAARLRLCGLLIIGTEALRYLVDFTTIFYFQRYLAGPYTTLSFEFYWEYLRFDLFFIGLAVVALAEIFRLGTQMKEEQELTV